MRWRPRVSSKAGIRTAWSRSKTCKAETLPRSLLGQNDRESFEAAWIALLIRPGADSHRRGGNPRAQGQGPCPTQSMALIGLLLGYATCFLTSGSAPTSAVDRNAAGDAIASVDGGTVGWAIT